jgi:hypothetical protein
MSFLKYFLWEPLPIPTRVWRRVNEFLWRFWFVMTAVSGYAAASGNPTLKFFVSLTWVIIMSGLALSLAAMSGARSDAPSEAEEHAQGTD